MVELRNSLPQLSIHTILQHCQVVGTAGLLYFRAVESTLYWLAAVEWSVQTVNKPVLGLVIGDRTNLDWVLSYSCLVDYSIQKNKVREIWSQIFLTCLLLLGFEDLLQVVCHLTLSHLLSLLRLISKLNFVCHEHSGIPDHGVIEIGGVFRDFHQ
jgi:hypothetical protein